MIGRREDDKCDCRVAQNAECRDGWGRSVAEVWGDLVVQRDGGFPSVISLTMYSIFTLGDEGVETGSREG